MPYVDGNLSMLVIMPDAGTFDEFLSNFTPTRVNDIIGALTDQDVALGLPKFTFSTALDLKSVLTNLGMTDAFDEATADFSGIDGARDLFIQSVVHQAFINVDENGTEAAAATGIGFSLTSFPYNPVVFVVDHPFLFMIRDRETGLILFMGKVVGL
jgi:serpin B